MNSKDSQDLSPIINDNTSASSSHTETIHHFLPTFVEIEKKLASLEVDMQNGKSCLNDKPGEGFDEIRKVQGTMS
jgi:hypothetical protein